MIFVYLTKRDDGLDIQLNAASIVAIEGNLTSTATKVFVGPHHCWLVTNTPEDIMDDIEQQRRVQMLESNNHLAAAMQTS